MKRKVNNNIFERAQFYKGRQRRGGGGEGGGGRGEGEERG